MYRLRYFSDFKSINNNSYCVAIYINTDDAISAEELTLSADAVSIEYSSDDIFQPLKQSGCTINILTPSVLTDLHTAELNNVYVKILKNGNLFWFGFLTPNLYSSEYTSDYNLLSLNCIDIISQLEYIKYTASTNSIKSFYDVIVEALSKIDPTHIINNIYLHKVLSLDNSYDVLNNLYIQERNFYDEESEPQTYKGVLEDMLRYLGMTLIQFRDSYYIIDYSSLKANSNFIKYDISASSFSEVSMTDYRTSQNIGIAESNGTISLGNIYNKVSVVANNNPINDSLPGIFDELTNQNTDTNKTYEATRGDYRYLAAYFNSSEWETEGCRLVLGGIPIAETTLDLMMRGESGAVLDGGIISGTVFQKSDAYKIEDGEPSSLRWTDYLTMIETGSYSGVTQTSIKASKDSVIYKAGYFIIDIEYMLSQSSIPTDTVSSSDAVFTQDKYTSTFEDTKFKALLKIGDYYYDGKTWTTAESYFYLCRKNKEGEKIFTTAYHLTNQVSYTEELIDSGDGVLIKLPDYVLNGTLEFQLYKPDKLGNSMNYRTDKPSDYTLAKYCHIKNIKFVYTTKNTHINVFEESSNDDLDVLYENVIDSFNITEMDDLEMRVNTYSPKAGSYSYVLRKSGEIYDFVDNISKGDKADISESLIIDKYYNHYKSPKFIYNDNFNNKDIRPYTIVHMMSLNRDMIVDGIIYNLSSESAEITLKEV